ncbi:MAG: chondroitinase family protein, partial [Oscillospiraceae bacterium]
MSLINFNSSERDIFKGENLEFADGFSKVGNESLKWDYKNGESFSINTPVNFSFEKDPKNPQAEFAFAMYIGFKKNYEGKFTVAFQKDGMTCCWFNFYGGFVGWRYLRLLFEDMEGTPVCGMDSIKITAENDGEIFFNEMITANYSDVRLTTPSYQIPTIKSKYTSGIMTRGELKATYEPATFDDSVIRERLKKYVICEYGKNINAKLAMEKFLSINIVEIEKGIFQGNKMEYMSQRAMLDNTDGEKVQYITLRTCTDLARDLAITYIKTEDAEYKKAYILLLKYLMFCGISEGSAVGVHHLLDYSLKPLYMSIAVMYKEIEAENLGDEVSRFCRWFTHVNKR